MIEGYRLLKLSCVAIELSNMLGCNISSHSNCLPTGSQLAVQSFCGTGRRGTARHGGLRAPRTAFLLCSDPVQLEIKGTEYIYDRLFN